MARAFAGAVLAWTVVPGHTTATSAAPVLGALPVMLLTVGVARHLAVGLFEREQDQSREAARAALGGQLLGVIDRRQIMEQASATAEAICEATPGLRAAMLHRDDDALRIVGAGGFLRPPTTLPLDILPSGLTAKEPLPITPSSSLVLSSGIRGEWLCLAMPDEPESYMLLGAVPPAPRAAAPAAPPMLNQVALALRTSTVHRELKAQALTDGLTGLANRSAFTAAMNRALNTPGYDGWVLFLDLDDFKMVNDSLGHLAGDRLLAHLGTLLTSTVRSEDVCARLGGDEIAVLLQGASEDVPRRYSSRRAGPGSERASGRPDSSPGRRRTWSCTRPTWPCTRRRARARTGSSSSTRAYCRSTTPRPSRPSCGPPSTAASWCWPTSRSSPRSTGPARASRPSSAGTTRPADCSAPVPSSRWPRRPAPSSLSA